MSNATMKLTLSKDITTVWNIITNLQDASWRSDIDHIKVIDERTFMEYTKDGFATTFTITAFVPMERYEFDMDNENMYGHWIGLFHGNQLETVVEFTEQVTAKKVWMKPLVKGYLKKQQSTYRKDLTQALDL